MEACNQTDTLFQIAANRHNYHCRHIAVSFRDWPNRNEKYMIFCKNNLTVFCTNALGWLCFMQNKYLVRNCAIIFDISLHKRHDIDARTSAMDDSHAAFRFKLQSLQRMLDLISVGGLFVLLLYRFREDFIPSAVAVFSFLTL